MKEKKALISIIVITKNAPLLLLTRCMDCIRTQTYTNLEIILLDANEQNSPHKVTLQEKLSDWDDVLYIDHPDDGEFVTGKNEALRRATGKYITFLSSQDTMPSKRMEEVYRTFAKRPNLSAVCTVMTVQENQQLERSDYALFSDTFEYLPQLIIHRKAFQEYGNFDAGFVALCDEEFWFRLSKYGYITYLYSKEATVSVCVDDYRDYTDYNAAIACRQFVKKYEEYYKKDKTARKKMFQKAARYYKKANYFLRYIQFLLKSVYWKKERRPHET